MFKACLNRINARRLVARCLLLSVVLVLVGCAALQMQTAEAPRVSISRLALTDLSLFEQRFALTLRLENPNEFALPISGFDYALELDGETFATGVSDRAVTVPALGEGEVTLSVASNLLANLEQFRRWQRDPPSALDYRVSGRLSVADAPVRLPFEYASRVDLSMER